MISGDFIAEIKKQGLSSLFTQDPAERYVYGYDNSRKHVLPDGVFFARHAEDVQTIIQLCNQFCIPIMARGMATSTQGGAVPVTQGVVLSLSRMNQIKEINPIDRYLVTEPGVTNQTVQEAAKKQGFFWGPDPTSAAFSTIGGNLAYNSAGPHTVKYGTPRDNTLGLKAITGNGDLIKTGVYTTKGVVGYDLTRLIIGSEGTLAIVVEATLKLTPLPETKKTLRACYSSVETAAIAITKVMSGAITPAVLEFMDTVAINLIRPMVSLPESCLALLLVEIDGQHHAIEQDVNAVSQMLSLAGAIEIKQAKSESDIQELWKARKILSPAQRKIAPHKINEDIVVPISQIPVFVHFLQELAQHHKLMILSFGHAGNGNLHVNILYDQNDPDENKRAHLCLTMLFKKVLELRGTLSGEHGIGLDKKSFVAQEIDPITLSYMHKIKRLFDPHKILNPGKLFEQDK